MVDFCEYVWRWVSAAFDNFLDPDFLLAPRVKLRREYFCIFPRHVANHVTLLQQDHDSVGIVSIRWLPDQEDRVVRFSVAADDLVAVFVRYSDDWDVKP